MAQHQAQANADLLQAALDSDIPGISRAVAMGADVNFIDSQRRFALSIAAAQHDMVVLDRLLQLNADPNNKNADGHTALYAAAAQGHEDIVRRLLTWGMTDTEDMGEAAVLAERQGNFKLCARILAHLNRLDEAHCINVTQQLQETPQQAQALAQAVMQSWQADRSNGSREQQAVDQQTQQQALDATSCSVQQLLLSVARLARPEAQHQCGAAAAPAGAAAAGAACSSDDKKQRTG